MQGPTHLLTGILIDHLMPQNVRHRHIAIIVAGIISHGLLDRVARATYHPAEPQFNNWFWVSYHATLWVICVVIVVKYWQGHWFAMLATMLPDGDWLLRAILMLIYPTWHQTGEMPLHRLAYTIVDYILPSMCIQRLPILTNEHVGSIPEAILVCALWYGVTYYQRKNKDVALASAYKIF